ncbi:5'-methylthioadenosine/adenosylhomocysteine nucleosidase [Agathobacter ruminis]|uniref:adenosylhomocysteine nucleosidase n=1 Tax=Agathobacter ruminis TaxID=1712665 RepID=A0A2G3E0J0_9FIRM|nr:5'-methylthioadenosine/adenosylhomocysteine nucleosidase [Agathobacter ruminis]MDC7301317.1 5'-methylthioadenosine/adenosylhomocysteine nucleosidase [Agathobacter ruminis]PHU36802.1 S-adenosylhomocysteine nucleosidase [Agathobacter ruminis]
MKIGIIGAMQMEVDNLKEALQNQQITTISGVEFVSGTIGNIEVVAAVSGVGKVFAAICTEAMILHFAPDCVINIGVAGSLTRDLSVLDIAVAKAVCQHDMDTSPIGDPVGLLSGINEILLPADQKLVELLCSCIKEEGINYRKGIIASGDQFIARDEQRDFIRDHFEAIAAEMEGGSIGHVCYVNKVPFAVLRAISDSEGAEMDYQTFAERAAERSIDVVLKAIAKLDSCNS